MKQMTYEQVLAAIDPAAAQRAVADSVIYLGGKLDWGSDEFQGVQECLGIALAGSGLPGFGDQSDEVLKFWGTLSLEAGNDCDYEPEDEDAIELTDEVSDPRVVFYTNEGFFEPETSSYLVAKVTENQAGFDIWRRYPTLDLAQAEAVRMNLRFEVDPDAVLTVVASSMRLSNLR
jgi:hypothetical protein